MHQNDSLKISIIIPVLNEAEHIAHVLKYLNDICNKDHVKEIIIVDGGSTDNTPAIAKEFGATLVHSEKGRAKQMNKGTKKATGSIFYFLHADTFPPKDFDTHIVNAVAFGNPAGCFRMKFDSNSWLLRASGWLTRINIKVCRGGDQSLFITKKLWERSEGYNESYIIYEDTEFIGRLYKLGDFKVLPQTVLTSARKYNKNGTIRLQYHFGVIHFIKLMGAGPERLYRYYKKNILT
ncbi:glycosyl transferase family 2 [Sediminicola sp. YIK13]|uniref:TIGR04283 family arsenosugar biosynthesis glycosyltransferase n=1 Tax=Sediminicola sp. YIK13 TaxID=1453352 RepID=UPI000720082A|nr:TIGR04283 family arsenosugar biosynthesis glycosyltransferase [Sediminicola sp. YIK13]ALM08063.1 glycosyl transferase family 2 [Sediminicola sp. YIK13]